MLCVGVDIVSIERIEAFAKRFKTRGLRRFLSDSEISLVKTPSNIAGFFAAKEACAKALKCGIGKELGFHDILLSKSTKGAPLLQLTSEKLDYFKVQDLSLSISHDGGFAIAVVAVSLQS
ncbi:holo-ACP synthase [Helicobacter turcicus]|uniref:Holo-[acyl-carrier-protein] synthase n=1 Tax=Helicobacter turcicus TaxID=2867412 RepID=A0ABS7JLA7_9HELI|nr:holo-ACP synthase [Helicobacter turcicus]MBX7490161.1 holo-ACP synthase [Helicobacter turcicus]MBX7545019.1 holo-ACP synthase [Helicobacter turcicus]